MAAFDTRCLFHFAPILALLSLVVFIPTARAEPKSVYLIRNAEEPSLGLEGLTPVGQQRADQCLPEVFSGADYGIGLIISCTPDVNTSDCHTAVATASPIATALGLTVNTQCSTIEANLTLPTCVPDLIKTYHKTNTKSVLIVWDVEHIEDLLDEFDLENDEPDYPKEWPDIIYTLRNGYFIGQSSQSCPGIDGSSTGAAAPKAAGATTASFGSTSKTIGEPLSLSGTDDTTNSTTTTVSESGGETPSSETVPEPVTTFGLPDLTATLISGEVTSTPAVSDAEPTPTSTEGLVAKRELQKMRKRHMKKRLALTNELNDSAM